MIFVKKMRVVGLVVMMAAGLQMASLADTYLVIDVAEGPSATH